jgi:hypothetical protein
MPYNFITTLEFDDLLAEKLGDIEKTFWSANHLAAIRKEALLTFGATAQFWKSRDGFATTNNQIFYDITSILSINKTQTFGDIIQLLNFDLMEDLATSTNYNFADVLKIIDYTIDKYLLETNLILKRELINVAAGTFDIPIPNYISSIFRLAFFDGDSYRLLKKDNKDNIEAFERDLLLSDSPPKYYSPLEDFNSNLEIYPPANVNGKLELIGTLTRDKTIAINENTLINLPNNLIPYIKYGVLEHLLTRDDKLASLTRAKYCKKRWQEGIEVGRNYTSILTASLNGRTILPDSLISFDNFNYGWQNQVGKPSNIAIASYNLLALNKNPNEIINLLFDLVVNAPINSNYIEIKQEYIPALLNYAYFLAQFKCGFSNIQDSISGYDEFMKVAAIHNSKVATYSSGVREMFNKTKREEIQNPVYNRNDFAEQQAANAG